MLFYVLLCFPFERFLENFWDFVFFESFFGGLILGVVLFLFGRLGFCFFGEFLVEFTI